MKPSPFRTAWALTRPFFAKRGAWAARGLVVVIIALNLGEIWAQVLLSDWNRRFFNAAQELNREVFMHEAMLFPVIVAPLICAYSLESFLTQMLRMRWRAWLTRQCLDLWFQDQAYYRLQWAQDGTDNPDQRISEDVSAFVNLTSSIFINLLYSAFGLFSFVAILWRLSGSADLHLPLVGDVHLPGYLVWGVLAYAVIGTLLIHRVGRPLVKIEYQQELREADFRYALVRVRENAESIALYGGEPVERRVLLGRFDVLLDNTWSLIRRKLALSFATSSYSNGATIIPWMLASGRYFAGAVKFGDLMQAVSAFGQVRHHLSVIVDNYVSIATWRATVDRLAGFAVAVQSVRPAGVGASAAGPSSTIVLDQVAGGGRAAPSTERETIGHSIGQGRSLTVTAVTTHTPAGQAIGAETSLLMAPGERVLLRAPSGSGKTTLLRAIAGIWPFGSGAITLPATTPLVLSQRPYLPLGSLRDALCFPRPAAEIAEPLLVGVLQRVGLGRLVAALDQPADWSHVLSLGEQQRVAFARALIVRPGLLVLDEATSALDQAAERAMYQLITDELPEAIVLSVGHRDSLGEYHHRLADLGEQFPDQARPA